MKRVISKGQLVLLFSYVIFIAHTLAEPREEAFNAFKAQRQRQLEARFSARTSANLQSVAARSVAKPDQTTDTNNGNWAGAVQMGPTSSTFNSVSAHWEIPAASSPPLSPAPGFWGVSTWVGIDGSGTCMSTNLAVGVNTWQDTSNGGTVTSGSSCWYQWYPGAFTTIESVGVTAGDQVQAFVNATTLTQAQVVVENLTTGQSSTVPLIPPAPGVALCGYSVEWIVDQLQNQVSGLARFDNVFFQNCAATTTTSGRADLTGASILSVEEGGVKLVEAAACNDSALEVVYINPLIPETPCGQS